MQIIKEEIGVRQIVLDTETTGISPQQGHSIIEIAAIELNNCNLTENYFHQYINPQHEISAAATAIHGLTLKDLQDKPTFTEIVADFLEFIEGAELIIHNAPFDMRFLNSELARLRLPALNNKVTDTLKMARALHPKQKNDLDTLCVRYQIDNSQRTLHGALLDAELLAEVYLAMSN